MIILAGKKYAKNSGEMVQSLFDGPSTCTGYYRINGGGVLFLDLQKNPFAFAVRRSEHNSWWVTAGRDSATGRTRYMFGIDEITLRRLGLDALKPSEQRRAAWGLAEV